jgi:hypothetical protein
MEGQFNVIDDYDGCMSIFKSYTSFDYDNTVYKYLDYLQR